MPKIGYVHTYRHDGKIPAFVDDIAFQYIPVVDGTLDVRWNRYE